MAQTRVKRADSKRQKEIKKWKAAISREKLSRDFKIPNRVSMNDVQKALEKSNKKLAGYQETIKKFGKMAKPAVVKRVAKKSLAKRLVGKHLAKAIPGVGAAIIARDVIKGVSKATCSKKGGKWVSGKCQGAKKDTRKITSPKARDLKSKR